MSELYKKFGELLKLERKRKGIKLEELSEQLKITEANLEFIEEGQASSLPSMIYYNLFAKAYSEALGIDFSRTIDAIKEDLGEAIENNHAVKEASPTQEKPSKTAAKAKPRDEADENGVSIKKLLYIFGGIVAVFIVFIVLYLVFFASDKTETGQTVSPPETSEVTRPEPAEESEEQIADEYDWSASQYDEPTRISLKLVSREQCWSTVLADGDTVIFRNLMPGRIYDAEAEYRMTVSVGIPSQVDIELNGQKVNLRDSLTGRISRVEINQLNLDEILARGVETTPPPVTTSPQVQPQRNVEPVAEDSVSNSDTDREENDEA